MTTWNDEYGDLTTDAEIELALNDFERWLHGRSWALLWGVELNWREDIVQEGRIAMWQAMSTWNPKKGALPSWLTSHANWRMKSVLTRKIWTGQPTNAGTPNELLSYRGIQTPLSLNKLMENVNGIDEFIKAAQLPDSIEIAYHHGEIAQALSELTPSQRRYVWLRFWKDVRGQELKAAFGYEPQGFWTSPKNGAKWKLKKQLAHLM